MSPLTVRPLLSALLFLFASTACAEMQIGDELRGFFGKDQRGEKIDIAAFKGRVVVMTFWATWCGPCIEEFKVLARLQQLVPTSALVVLSVNFKEDFSNRRLRSFYDGMKKFPVTLALDPYGALSRMYGVKSVPHMFLVNKRGTIAAIHKGYAESQLDGLVEEINGLLLEPALQTTPEPEALAQPQL